MGIEREREKTMLQKTQEAAFKQASANARTFNKPYMVFTDTAGNWRCEAASKTRTHDATIVWACPDCNTLNRDKRMSHLLCTECGKTIDAL